MGGAYRTHGKDEIRIKDSGRKTWKSPHGRLRYRWEDNIRMDASDSAYGPIAGFREHDSEYSGSIK